MINALNVLSMLEALLHFVPIDEEILRPQCSNNVTSFSISTNFAPQSQSLLVLGWQNEQQTTPHLKIHSTSHRVIPKLQQISGSKMIQETGCPTRNHGLGPFQPFNRCWLVAGQVRTRRLANSVARSRKDTNLGTPKAPKSTGL